MKKLANNPRLTKRQAETVQAVIETGSQTEAAKKLGVSVPTVHINLDRAMANGGFDMDAFQLEQNQKFVQKAWRIIDQCSDLLETKLMLLTDTEKLDKEDASRLSRVIYDLRRSMQGSVSFIQVINQRSAEAQLLPTDLEGEALLLLSDRFKLSTEEIIRRLSSSNES